MQEVTDYGQAKNLGRANELTPEQDAVQVMAKRILAKARRGYVEEGQKAKTEGIDEDLPLPENLSFYKPDNTLSASLVKRIKGVKRDDGSLLFTRKRDGERFILRTTGDGSVEMYSSKMLTHHHLEDPSIPWTERFAHLVDAAETAGIPPNSILLGELVPEEDKDDRWYVASIMKTKTDESLARQAADRPLMFYCWDIAQWDGESLIEGKYDYRLEIMEEFFAEVRSILPPDSWDADAIFSHFETYMADHGDKRPVSSFGEYWRDDMPDLWNVAIAVAVQFDWEGWVVVDLEEEFGDKAMNFRGKTYRPGKASGKLKPFFEDDFIAQWDPEGNEGSYGKGKRTGLLGAVSLYQLNEAGEEVYICECGGGVITEKAFYEDPENNDPASWPRVLQVRYETRTYQSNGDKTDALQFPRVIQQRTDKEASECVNPRL